MTVNQKQYKKEVQRVKAMLKRLEKRGYIFTSDITEIVGEQPKRITAKKLAELKAIKTRNLYKYTQGVDLETGEIIGYKALQEKEKRAKSKKLSLAYAKRRLDLIPRTTTSELVREQIESIKEQFWYQLPYRSINGIKKEVNVMEELFYKNYGKVGYNEFLAKNEREIMDALSVVVNYEKTIDIALEKLAGLLNFNDELTGSEKERVQEFESEVLGYEDI